MNSYRPSRTVFRRNGRTGPLGLRAQIVAFTLARLVLNTGHRMVYPFLPAIARGLGVELEAVALAVTARSALGLISPLFGSLADRRGRRVAMLVGLGLFSLGMALIAVWPVYPALVAGLLLASAAKLIFDPAMQAYIGDRVPYARRGRALAVTELSWSFAFLLGMPLAGWLIARADSWRAPFPWLAGLALVAVVGLFRAIPPDRPAPGTRLSLAAGVRIVLQHPAALAALAVGLLISLANEMVFIVYGAWLEDAFGLRVAALGLASAVIGVSELAAEGGVAGIVDRIGKRRAVILGSAGTALASLLLPVAGFSVVGALAGLFLFFLTFEFALVSLVPLMTELVPGARATMMAGNVTALSAGRMLGALLGPLLFSLGLTANTLAAAAMNVAAVVIVLLWVQRD
ncbi:MAG: MFS transporter [Chloroflexota bacterium]|nr:MFS transporter [Anaerolineae bacterium]HMM29743.1 MFS transporter [Aggregatilineaceae bacterium]